MDVQEVRDEEIEEILNPENETLWKFVIRETKVMMDAINEDTDLNFKKKVSDYQDRKVAHDKKIQRMREDYEKRQEIWKLSQKRINELEQEKIDKLSKLGCFSSGKSIILKYADMIRNARIDKPYFNDINIIFDELEPKLIYIKTLTQLFTFWADCNGKLIGWYKGMRLEVFYSNSYSYRNKYCCSWCEKSYDHLFRISGYTRKPVLFCTICLEKYSQDMDKMGVVHYPSIIGDSQNFPIMSALAIVES